MGWIWKKSVSVGKKILAACVLVTSAPFVVPPLAIATAIALISSFPYCLLLACYVCAEKLMRLLLPASAFGGRCDKMILFPDEVGHSDNYNEGMARMAMGEPVLVQAWEDGTAAMALREEGRTPFRLTNTEDEEIEKESKSLLVRIRNEGRTNQSLDRGLEEEDNKNVTAPLEDLARKKQVSGTRASKGKHMERSSNEMYSEEQIWIKMEALRKVVGYSVARSTTYSEELKALYMFTGVELPTSMLDKNQDIGQVSESLCFLMSVVGIK